MQRERFPPDDPREWLNRARGNLVRARQMIPGAYLEDLCFDAQQAAEKAIKAVLLKRGVNFAYVHDLAELLTSVEASGQAVPDDVREAEDLTRFAVGTRYPGGCRACHTGRPRMRRRSGGARRPMGRGVNPVTGRGSRARAAQ